MTALVAHTTAPGDSLRALSELRKARKANRLQGLPWSETLYRVYIIAIGVGGVVWWITTLLGNKQVSASAVADVRRIGPAIVGLVLAALFGNALRSGARGASLTLEPADVAHILQSPLPRSRVLRRPAIHSVRKGLFHAILAGGVCGALSAPFLPGGPSRWIFFSSGLGALCGLASAGLALVIGGQRLSPRMALIVSVVLLAWSGIDIARRAVSSPMSFAGSSFLRPIGNVRWANVGSIGLVVAAVLLVGVAFAGLGGVGIEAAERRARLVSQLRFAVSTQDLRAVVLLRRQLASERSRRRPWLTVTGKTGPGGAVVTRGIRSIARWPLARIGRALTLSVIAGIALRLSFEGTLPLVLVSALCFFVVGLDLVEPMAQDADRPDILKSFPRHRGRMANRQLIVPGAVALFLGVIAGLAAILTGLWTGTHVTTTGETMIAVYIAALAGSVIGALAAAVNVCQGPPSLSMMLSTPEFAFLRTALPVIVTVLGTAAPLFSARVAAHAPKNPSVPFGIVRGMLAVGLISYGIVLWITDGGIREPK